MEGLPGLTAGRTRGETRAGALLAKLESVREEIYAFNVASASSPGEFEFSFRSPIRLHVGQAESIPQNWADIHISEFYEEWLNAMKLELDGHIEIGTFSADVVPKWINVVQLTSSRVRLGQSFKTVGYGSASCWGDLGAGSVEADVFYIPFIVSVQYIGY